ncbi:MAG: VgrG-related protein [Promicromonosporaceae bacterium]|nr:VgrG-related protein [Promicromonosporaceae bacterium]
MPGDWLVQGHYVDLDGKPCADLWALTSIRVEAFANAPDHVVVRIADPEGTVVDAPEIKVGATFDIGVRDADQSRVPLFSGELTAVEHDIDVLGRVTTLRGLDRAHRLFLGRRTDQWNHAAASDVARAVASRHGLRADVVPTSQQHDWIGQLAESDWDLLRRLADDVGYVLTSHGGTLTFAPPVRAQSGTHATSAHDDPLVVENGVNLIALHASLSAAGQVPSVTVRGWDPQGKKTVVGTSKDPHPGFDVAGASPAALSKPFGASPFAVGRATATDQTTADGYAQALAQRLGGGSVELDVETLGEPTIMPGAVVALARCGDRFDGRYTVTSARHEIADGGYVTTFTVAGASDRSLAGMAAGGAPGASSRPPGRGVLPAIVTNVRDPQQAGRVKVSVPYLFPDVESFWAQVVQQGAGKDRGLVLLPEVNDQVLVAFAEGDLEHPYVLGGLFSSQDTIEDAGTVVGDDGAVGRRALTSRTGLHLEITETPQGEKIELTSKDRKERVSVLQKPQTGIEVQTTGPVTIKAQQEVTVQAAQKVSVTSTSGDVAVSGKAITVQGTEKIALSAPQITIDGSAKVEVHGAMVKVAADATAELSAAAETTVRGALVRIN